MWPQSNKVNPEKKKKDKGNVAVKFFHSLKWVQTDQKVQTQVYFLSGLTFLLLDVTMYTRYTLFSIIFLFLYFTNIFKALIKKPHT